MPSPYERFIPPGATLVDPDGTDAAVYTYEHATASGKTRLAAIAYSGKGAKPVFHEAYMSEAGRAERVKAFIAGRHAAAEYKRKAAEERKRPHDYKAGDILVSSWGYEQTNVDFYEVTEVPSPMMVIMRKIGGHRTDTGYESGTVLPVPGAFIGAPMRKKVSSGAVSLTSYSSAFRWDGKPKHWSSYA